MENLVPIEVNDQRILTTQQLAEVYETDVNNIRNNFKNNKNRFIEGKHYYLLQGEDLRNFKREVNNIDVVKPNVKCLYLWTERGANRHCKILDTDKAWEQFDNLEETYFRVKTGKYEMPTYLNPASAGGVASLINTFARGLKEQGASPVTVATQIERIGRQCGVDVIEDYTAPGPYSLNKQMSLLEEDNQDV